MDYEFIYINAKKYKDDNSFMRNLLEIIQEELDEELLDDEEKLLLIGYKWERQIAMSLMNEHLHR